MTARLITPPTTYGVSVAFAKDHVRVLSEVEDELVEHYLAAALAHVESFTGRVYEPQTWELTIDAFPDSEIQLAPGPAASVTSISYADEDGLPVTVDPDHYETDLSGDDGWILPALDFPWPAALATINAVTITYVAGRGAMPADMKQAVMMLAAHFYAEREGAQTPDGVTTILMRHLRYVL